MNRLYINVDHYVDYTNVGHNILSLAILKNSQECFKAGNYLFKVNIETLEQGAKHVRTEQQRHQNVVVCLLLILNIFHTFF